MLAARISLVAGADILGQGLVRAIWTDDSALSTKINPRVAHYTGQAELAEVIQEGLAAREAGDVETATSKLGRAVDVVDARTGTVRLKHQVAGVDAEMANVRSVRTVRVKNG